MAYLILILFIAFGIWLGQRAIFREILKEKNKESKIKKEDILEGEIIEEEK